MALTVDPIDYRRSSSKIPEYERNLFVADSPLPKGYVALPKQFIINEHVSALDIAKRISGLLGSFGSGVSGSSRFVGDADGKAQRDGLKNTNEDQETVKNQGPPIFRRLILAIFLEFSGYGICVWGVLHFDDKRRGWRSTFMIGGCLIVISGLLLIWASDFSSTWTWSL
ncbi:MAG: hypothetical protein CR217_00290 [Beijerinckiaceae bacterium]|nr:MAG: hypothetical protein CR217_00290 [Beijerinckiaceae bacterium]